MELFSVQRYTENQRHDDPNREREILKGLLEKLEKRKHNAAINEPEQINPEAAAPKRIKLSVIDENKTDRNEESHQSDQEAIPDKEAVDSFQPLNDNVFKKKTHVEMVLPSWLAHPIVIPTNQLLNDESSESVTNFSFLANDIKDSLQKMGIKQFFPVQTIVIPWILQAHDKPPPFRPRDICVSAPTGSGKTLAFAIPVVQLLVNRTVRKIRALVILPVAELALQVFKVFKQLTKQTSLTVCLLSKTVPFAVEQQHLIENYKGQLYSKVDILIATPGRLVEHLHATEGFCLKSLKFLIIDEADRIIDQVHHNWLYHLDEHVKATSDTLLSGSNISLSIMQLNSVACKQPHKMLFSATLSQDPEKLQELKLFQPKLFTSVLASSDHLTKQLTEETPTEVRGEFIGKYTTPAELTEKYCLTETRVKPLTLFSMITENNWTKFLCFTNSAASSGRLAFVLNALFEKSLIIEDLSAVLNPKQRATVLSRFARGKVNGLVCSDALARGIDIPDVDVVISYDPARHIKTYIHRIGRTARAGRPGMAVTLLSQKEFNLFNQILSQVGKVITEEIKVNPDAEGRNANLYAKALQSLRKKLEKDKHSKIVLQNIAKQKVKQIIPENESTLMERLQTQIAKEVVERASSRATTKERKKSKSAKAFKEKKLLKKATMNESKVNQK